MAMIDGFGDVEAMVWMSWEGGEGSFGIFEEVEGLGLELGLNWNGEDGYRGKRSRFVLSGKEAYRLKARLGEKRVREGERRRTGCVR